MGREVEVQRLLAGENEERVEPGPESLGVFVEGLEAQADALLSIGERSRVFLVGDLDVTRRLNLQTERLFGE